MFGRHHQEETPPLDPPADAPEISYLEQREFALRTELGNQFCSSRGCKEETGLPCAYLDRRDRQCPTAWCPEHRVIVHGELYCKPHASLVEGTSDDYGSHAHPDLDNRVPALVNWITR